jgi:hypothetical protein
MTTPPLRELNLRRLLDLGLSGNHCPAGSFSLDYCAFSVAGMLESVQAAQIPTGMRFDEGWLT